MDEATAARTRAELAAAASEQAWLTAVLRPAGSLDGPALRRLGTAVAVLAGTSDMVLLDLSAAVVRDPRALARALREPAAGFDQPGQCLLVAGAGGALTAELERAGVAAVAMPRGALPALAPARAAA